MIEYAPYDARPTIRIYVSADMLIAMLMPSQEPPESKKEKGKNEPKPAPPPPPPPVFEMSAAAGPYRPKPVAPPEPPKESWLRRHKNKVLPALIATASAAAYVVSQIL